jgi:hypothetical protein
MPLATELLPLMMEQLDLDEMNRWLANLQERLVWLSGNDEAAEARSLNVEEIFHYAHFDIEQFRLRQHLEPVGRHDGPGTAWNSAEAIGAWLSYLEEALRDVIFEQTARANLAPITRWAKSVSDRDTVLTFNYDTLVERALKAQSKTWNHATRLRGESGIPVCKLHGSIDWIVAHRRVSYGKCDLLYDKPNANREEGDNNSGHVEEDYRLWRCKSHEQLGEWLTGRDLQGVPEDAAPASVGIAGLGAYKPLHHIPGLGQVWWTGMSALRQADSAVVVGFSMSDFDAMAQMQFAEISRRRATENRPHSVTVVDVEANAGLRARFERVFRDVAFVKSNHDAVDWSRF